MNGKGSQPRPKSISQQQFSDNWDKAFGKKKKIPSLKEVAAKMFKKKK